VNLLEKEIPVEKEYKCETCPMRQKAEANPKSFMSRLWKWHTGWCPGWKEYQAHLQSIQAGQKPTAA
jgi:hypothetical protein